MKPLYHQHYFRNCFTTFACVAFMLQFVGCVADNSQNINNSLKIAEAGKLSAAVVATPYFPLQTYRRVTNPDLPTRFYIEGDGFAWADRSTPSFDPTPTNLMMLRLAADDPYPNVVYVARPCQFILAERCTQADWTDARFSADKVQAMAFAIQIFNAQHIELVGYSGGAAIAVLLSQVLTVDSVRTIAGNLDPEAFNAYHQVRNPEASLSTHEALKALAHTPQLHMVGEEDEIVPPELVEQAVAAEGEHACAKIVRVPGATHGAGYSAAWQQLIKHPLPVCN